jgi:acetyl-CoA acetyltransferase
VCFDTQLNPMILGINENKYFQSCHTSRDNTRAGFETSPLVSVEKGCSSISKKVQAYTTVRSGNTKYSGLLSM